MQFGGRYAVSIQPQILPATELRVCQPIFDQWERPNKFNLLIYTAYYQSLVDTLLAAACCKGYRCKTAIRGRLPGSIPLPVHLTLRKLLMSNEPPTRALFLRSAPATSSENLRVKVP